MSDTLASRSSQRLLAQPELAEFKALAELIEVYDAGIGTSPLAAYHMLVPKEDRRDTTAVEAAIQAATLGSFLIDDVMDRDESKPDFGMDEGRRSNFGGALIVVAYRLLAECDFPDSVRLRLISELSQLLLEASAAQELEARLMEDEQENTDPEGNYWKVLHGKSSQQIGRGLKMGAIMAGAPELEEAMFQVGVAIGDMAQISDDITDAIYKILTPDWETPGKNILIIFGLHENNPRRDEFAKHFATATTDPEAHRAARQILIETGAVGFGFYHYFDRHRKATKLLDGIVGYDTTMPRQLLAANALPLASRLEELGIELPAELKEELQASGTAAC